MDDFDEYTHNNCVKLIKIFSSIGSKNDDHKKMLFDSERNYLLDLAKAADHNDDVIFQKEEDLKSILLSMKNSIDKVELDKALEDAFKIMDDLEIEYRDFFNKTETLLDFHEGRLGNIYHLYELKCCLFLEYSQKIN